MIDVACKLITYTFTKDTLGNEIATESTNEIFIIRVEDIYADEFYRASQQNFKPTLRLVISTLSYNGESELEYMNERYSIIRTQMQGDETILVCERKVKDAG